MCSVPVVNAADPWVWLQESFPEVRVWIYVGDDWGRTIWVDGEASIYLAHDLGPVQRRATLAHELHHVQRGAPVHPRCERDEMIVRGETARWLLPDVGEVAHTLRDRYAREAARALWVPRFVLMDRLSNMTRDESDEFASVLGRGPLATVRPDAMAACAAPGDARRRSWDAPACHEDEERS